MMRDPETEHKILEHGISAVELNSYISVKRAAEMKDVSEDTFRRHYSHMIERVGQRRQAVRLRNALGL